MPFTDIHVITNADDVCHKRDHRGRLTHRLPMGDLGLALIQVLHLEPQEIACASKTEPRTGRLIPEERYGQAAVKEAAGNVVHSQAAQNLSRKKGGLELVIAFVPRQQKIILVHASTVEGVKPGYKFFDPRNIHPVFSLGVYGTMLVPL